MQAGLLEFANDAYRFLRNGMQERDEALGERKRFGQMLYAAGPRTGCAIGRARTTRSDAVRVVGAGADGDPAGRSFAAIYRRGGGRTSQCSHEPAEELRPLPPHTYSDICLELITARLARSARWCSARLGRHAGIGVLGMAGMVGRVRGAGRRQRTRAIDLCPARGSRPDHCR